MPSYQTPGVYIEEIASGLRPIQAVSTSIAAFIGVAPDIGVRVGEAVRIEDWSTFARIFVRDKTVTTHLANAVYGFLYPVTMVSNAFIAPELMPGWLGALAALNPLSSTITATRILFGNPGVPSDGWLNEHAIGMAVVWPVVITAVTLPLAVRAYRNLSR